MTSAPPALPLSVEQTAATPAQSPAAAPVAPAPRIAAAEPISPTREAPPPLASAPRAEPPVSPAPRAALEGRPAVVAPGAGVGVGIGVGAPLRVNPGVVVPAIRDPHAEFRKGNWKKPAALVAAAAAILGGLSFVLPSEEQAPPAVAAPRPRAEPAAIGASLPPERIVDTGEELTRHEEKFKKTVEAEATRGSSSSSTGAGSPEDFAKAFKAAASR